MTTRNNRIYISITKDMEEMLSDIAKQEKKPIATVATWLLKQAIADYEDQEDLELIREAEERMKHPKGFLTHEEIWK